VINQLAGEYECKDDMLRVYHEECLQLLREFKIVKLEHIPKYVLLEDELYYRTIDGVLLKCLGEEEAKTLMGEIHEGVCGAHQSTFKMKWMIRNNNYYWPKILEYCFKYY
jgi:hypothetical protein